MHTQNTIARPATIRGRGYWSGDEVSLQFRPAAAGSGLVFVRTDRRGARRIPAEVRYRIEIPRRTTLGNAGATVEMTEHVLAALSALQIDNCEIWVNQPEMPAVDGSSQAFVEVLEKAGLVPQTQPRPRLVVDDIVRVGDNESWVEARPADGDQLTLHYQLDYGTDSSIGCQSLELQITPETFCRELAPARTFLLLHEAEWLRSRGLGQHVKNSDLLVYGDDGPIGNTLRFEDECVRHKTLDLVGDLALAGCDVVGHLVAYRSGHRLNAELVEALLTRCMVESPQRRSA